jgi:L-ascorbate metabolism protein UlaG (beta-lactamase superfamily)
LLPTIELYNSLRSDGRYAGCRRCTGLWNDNKFPRMGRRVGFVFSLSLRNASSASEGRTRGAQPPPDEQATEREAVVANTGKVFLRPNVQVEPLIDRWYAWTYLIPPHTAARNLVHRQFKIMESYLAAPNVHANAVKNPKMLGGPFIDLDGRFTDEVRALKADIIQKRQVLLDLSTAISEAEALLRTNARGYSLNPLYELLPRGLRGYVELVYDLNNHPSLRFLEALLYHSKYYMPTAQSLMLSLTTGDDRPFVLSTPRLDTSSSVNLQLPFADRAVDRLFRAKTDPIEQSELFEFVPIPEAAETIFRSLFHEEIRKPYQRYTGPGVRWRYFGHACILVETREVVILFDPVLSYTYESGISRYTYDDLPDVIDWVVITHNHQDHILFETLLQLRHKITTIIVPDSGSGALQDPSLKLLLNTVGFENVHGLKELESVPLPDGELTALPFYGEHSDLNVRSKLAYLVRMGKRQLLFAADSCNIDPVVYEHVYNIIGPVDVLFIGMECDGAPLSWLYGPLITERIDRAMDESRRLAGSDYHQVMGIIDRLGCRQVYVYAMGQEPWLNYIMSLKYTPESRPITESNKVLSTCSSKGIVAERLFGEKEILLQ